MSRSDRIRVLHVVPLFSRGGVARVISDLIEGNDRVISSVASDGGDWIGHLAEIDVEHHNVPLFPTSAANFARGFYKLRSLIRTGSIDIVHSHHRFTSLVSRAAAGAAGIPLVCSVHDLAGGNTLLTRVALGGSIIVYSDAVARHLREHFHIADERIEHVTMGISTDSGPAPDATAVRTDLQCPLEAPAILFAGRAVEEKGPDLFIEAIPEIAAAVPAARFWFAGDGELRAGLEKRARDLKIKDRVMFLGWRDDIGAVMAAADIVVAPSRREGFGRSVLEAMSLGTAVVATAAGGLGELIDDGRNGVVVMPEPDSIAEGVIRLLRDRDLKTAVERAARDTARRFGRDAMVRETDEIYRRLQRPRR